MMLHAVGGIKEVQDLKPYDLVFFQILERKHFYVVVFELKNPAIYLLDNMQQGETVVTMKDDKDYSLESIPYKMASNLLTIKHLLVSYLQNWKHPKAGRYLKLEWGTEDNIIDCGVFLMRHMELFMGSCKKTFECGFKKDKAKQKNQTIALRNKYASRILLSNVNV
ncbi:hypothetical protein R6Q57_006231 [Mikania cordata]